MPGGYKNINGNDGNTFSSTNQPKDKGREKSIINVIREAGYSDEDIRKVYSALIWYTREEIHNIMKDDSKPWLIVYVAGLLDRAVSRKDPRPVKEILEYLLGSPQQNIKTSGSQKIEVIWNDRRRDNNRT